MSSLRPEDVRAFVLAHLATSFEARHLPTERVGDDFDLLDSGVIDSIGTLELISAVEERFDITIDLEALDIEDLTKVGPFSRYVAEHARATSAQ
jgi:acyl carrier protein